MGKRSGVFMLLVAILLGVGTSYLVWRYVQNVQSAAQAPEPVMVEVVVAKEDISARTVLRPEMLTLQRVPEEARHPQAYSNVDDVVGRVTFVPITANEQILSSKLVADRAASGLSFIIPPGKRAVSIGVSEVIGAGGLILPGDHVDIIGIFDAGTMGKDMAVMVLQNIEVLAVAQQLQGDAGERKSAVDQARQALAPARKDGQAATKPEEPQAAPKPNPKAATVTVAVNPEEAQRLVLAEANGSLRLALRPHNENGVVNIPEAVLSAINQPVQAGEVLLTGVSLTPTTLRAGDTLKVEFTVKNVSNRVIRSQGPEPGFTYVFGQTFHSQNFASEEGAWRVGLSFGGQAPVAYPYRWGFGGDLPPGTSTTITGYIKMIHDLRDMTFWAGLIREPAEIVQDNVSPTKLTVIPANTAVITVDVANVRSGPSISSSIIARLEYGTALPIVGSENDWYRVRLPDGREGYVAAGWIIEPRTDGGGA
jgi:pilus assembly protein CpaB